MRTRGSEFSVQYHPAVIREDIPRLPATWRTRIKRAIKEKLTVAPEVFGKPLRRSLKGYRKLRVGDYRVIFKMSGKSVKILVIQHRSVVYRNIPTP
ncbi:addiction module antitoxin RelB [Candidatus Jorgensenbacteria bacterium GWA1_54_12]|uniref:Addiction module antitoxin RelB n=1 Tax=Candidatus Jorgensenbacteria bacterium GWA1_54_12 TaxID=1798468 RepID=A0A1F6BKV7_9BACT|nr:MAG: addiction module antitoxin RelB [Candidatus Jorgensenbacteria bacterium GWA1_54_12]